MANPETRSDHRPGRIPFGEERGTMMDTREGLVGLAHPFAVRRVPFGDTEGERAGEGSELRLELIKKRRWIGIQRRWGKEGLNAVYWGLAGAAGAGAGVAGAAAGFGVAGAGAAGAVVGAGFGASTGLAGVAGAGAGAGVAVGLGASAGFAGVVVGAGAAAAGFGAPAGLAGAGVAVAGAGAGVVVAAGAAALDLSTRRLVSALSLC